MVLMMGHKICFNGGIWLIILKVFPLPLIWSTEDICLYFSGNNLSVIMSSPSDSSPFPIIETVPLGEHLPTSEKVVYRRNPVIDGIIDFTGGSMGN